ncbi:MULTISPECIES: BglG family transcription antiterminator [Aerococcus]|uniref:PTS sugar transporter subunit IIA n=1 Tax=Aerococcus mictus TaxID=2976810 RepID=A0A9Q4DGC5_9LACT|nr:MULTISPECIES: PTS sugar transporter subunit IIA [Aerococcus]MCY3030755.1 PTS sugar transporter subunit IIA [Aerococcus sp. Group 1]MCY3066000.1 PTS sugar transporter subunit IIA [Aerococcus mictus]MCY3069250.1 PTS sugar transporter subunit IIA [Aerococcus mictus]MCY3071141.1 PTS sugar transporter subunit IIA [Aerococcus mictus]MCY3074664.1 PTS sugar transporter subunit IIA [Aerococcus mictus]
MALVDRWYEILNNLYMHPKIPQAEFEAGLKTSRQTLKKNIQLLNQELEGIATITLEDKVYYLNIEDFPAFKQILAGKFRQDTDFNSLNKRQAYILKELIEDQEPVIIDDLAEVTMVSRGTVNNDINHLRQDLVDYNLTIVGTPNKGLTLEGDELDIRTAYVNIVLSYFKEDQFIIKDKTHLLNLAPNFNMTNFTKDLLLKVVYVTLLRVRQGHGLMSEMPHYQNFLQGQEDYEVFIAEIEDYFNLTLSHYEYQYLAYPFNIYNKEDIVPESFNSAFVDQVYQEVLQAIQRDLPIEFDQDELYQAMRNHLIFLLHRLLFRVNSDDLFFHEVQQQYPLSFTLAEITGRVLERELDREVPGIELSYLSLYFELVISRQTNLQSQKIAIVCHTGKGTARLIKMQIQRILGASLELSTFSEGEFSQEDPSHYFAIFTTIPLDKAKIKRPIIQLDNLFDESYIRSQWYSVQRHNPLFSQLVYLDFVTLDQGESYEDLLQVMTDKVIEETGISSDFQQAIFEREAISDTVFDQGIAMPHTVVEDFDQIILFIGQVEADIKEKGRPIDLVFLLGIPSQTNQVMDELLINIYEAIFAVANNQDLKALLKTTHSLEDIQDILQGDDGL